MWGRATQIVITVIALVLARPANGSPAPAMGPYVRTGHAFAAYPTQDDGTGDLRAPAPRSVRSSVRQVSYRPASSGDRTALIVGINHARGTPPLPGAVTDAINMRNALRGYGFSDQNVTVLLEEQATRPAILHALRALATRTPPNGVAVFAIATHTQRSRGTNLLATAEGSRVSAHELAEHLRAVRAPMWVALPTCYAAGYARPGVVGFNRVATFASAADRQAYEAGEAGSFLFIHMVRRAMVERQAPESVESAFAFARGEIERSYPEHVPSMSDGIPGELVLGAVRPAAREDWDVRTSQDRMQQAADASPAPSPRRGRRTVVVCSRFRYNCR